MRKRNPAPPKFIDKVLGWYCHETYLNEIKGDLQELYEGWVVTLGYRRARLKYALNALLFLRLYNSKFSQNNRSMTRFSTWGHHIKVGVRNLIFYRSFSIVNIMGLALGLTAAFVIFLHVSAELGYDKDYSKHARIFRVSTHQSWAKSPVNLGRNLNDYFSEVVSFCRFARYGNGLSILSNGDQQITSDNLFQVDESATEFFDLELTEGNSTNSLQRPYTALISASMATKLFGANSAIGKVVHINDNQQFEITGVYRDLPRNSHLKADLLISMSTFYENVPENWINNYGWMALYTYVMLRDEDDESQFRGRMRDFQKSLFTEEEWSQVGDNYFDVMPLADIHLQSDRIQEMGENSDMTYVWIFSALAVCILLIALVNFINIFTALAIKRIRATAIRKLVGATRASLIHQLLTEAVISATLAAVAGLVLTILTLPWYNVITDLDLTTEQVLKPANLLLISGLALVVGLLSGLYPALLVVRQDPLLIVARNENPKTGISYFRKGLVVFQFALSLFIGTGSLIIFQQMNFINNQDLGYTREKVLAIETYGDLRSQLAEKSQAAKNRLQQLAGVAAIGRVSNLPGEPLSHESFQLAERAPLDASVNMLWCDTDYLQVMNMELVLGKGFHRRDSGAAFVVNETLANQLGGEIVGQLAEWRGRKGPIVGVVKDFHHYSLKSGIEPMVLTNYPAWTSQWLVKLETEDVTGIIDRIGGEIKQIAPQSMFLPRLVETQVGNLYRGEQNMLRIAGLFTGLAILISCVGLMGLATLEVQRKTKEIGIRKVLGASWRQIFLMVSRQYLFMTLLAAIIAIPISLWIAGAWLANFELQIALSPWMFGLPGLALVLVTLMVVHMQSFRSISRNPSTILHHD